MPGPITHYLFAKDCIENTSNIKFKNIVLKNLDMFYLGCQGANFFNTCNYIPFLYTKNLSIYSKLIHTCNINDFIKNMIYYSTDNNCMPCIFHNDFNDITISYIYGFLSHYVLDTISHPYIYSLQFSLKDNYKFSKSKALHKGIETHIDTLLLEEFKNLTPFEFDEYKNRPLDLDKSLIICDMYKFLLEKVFNKSLLYNDINNSLNSFVKFQKNLNSSNRIYSMPYLYFKKSFAKHSYIENKIYMNYNYCVNDLLNINKFPWKDPFSKNEYCSSFLDIYFDARAFYFELVDILNLYLDNKKTMKDVLCKINDKSSFTNQYYELKYKNL